MRTGAGTASPLYALVRMESTFLIIPVLAAVEMLEKAQK